MNLSLSGLVLASSLILGSGFKAPTISLDDFLHPTWATVTEIEEAVSRVGLFAVTVGAEQQRQELETFQELVACIRRADAQKHVHVVEIEDGTVCSTLATSTNKSVAHHFDDDLQSHCPTFVGLAESVRAATATVGAAYAKMLDFVEQKDLSDEVGQFRAAVARSENLEHFYMHWRREEHKDELTLRMHTHPGMFIIMTPPQYFFLQTDQHIDSGVQMKLPNGESVTLEFPPQSLVVINGEGCAEYSKAPKMYVPPHRVVLHGDTDGIVQIWYGRTYLPPPNNVRLPATFNHNWTSALAAGLRTPAGQGPVHHRALLEQGSCSVGQLYCALRCMNTTSVSACPIGNIQCKDQTGTVWLGGATQCTGCTLVCSATESPKPSASSSPRPSAQASPRASASGSPRPSAQASPSAVPSSSPSDSPSASSSPRPSPHSPSPLPSSMPSPSAPASRSPLASRSPRPSPHSHSPHSPFSPKPRNPASSPRPIPSRNAGLAFAPPFTLLAGLFIVLAVTWHI